jgi:hypothetical protein
VYLRFVYRHADNKLPTSLVTFPDIA